MCAYYAGDAMRHLLFGLYLYPCGIFRSNISDRMGVTKNFEADGRTNFNHLINQSDLNIKRKMPSLSGDCGFNFQTNSSICISTSQDGKIKSFQWFNIKEVGVGY